MKETISLKELFQTFKKRLLLIIIITAIFTIISGVVSYYFLKPVYQSSAQILVNQSKAEKQVYDANEVQTSLQLINTYNVIIKSPAILDKVIEKEHLDMTSEALEKLVSVSSEQESQVVNIVVQYKNPQKSANIANAIAATFKSEIKSIMNVNNVRILTKAEEGLVVKPNPVLNMTVAFVVGLMAGIAIAFLLEYLDNTLKKEQDINHQLDLPVLGVINIIGTDGHTGQRESKIVMNATRGDSIGS